MQEENQVWANDDLSAFTLFAVPVETSKWESCSKVLKGPRNLQKEVAKNCLKTSRRESCIPECFVGHYRVKYDTGLNYPVNSWDALTAAPFRSAPPHRAEKTWPRFFIAVQILSRDSVCSRPYSWSDWRL